MPLAFGSDARRCLLQVVLVVTVPVGGCVLARDVDWFLIVVVIFCVDSLTGVVHGQAEVPAVRKLIGFSAILSCLD